MRKVRKGHFELMNARQHEAGLALRRKMIRAAMGGKRSGFAIQIREGGWLSDTAMATVELRKATPKER